METSVFSSATDEFFQQYEAELTFEEKLMGGTPKKPDVIEAWIRSKAGIIDEQEIRRMVIRTLQEQGVELPDIKENVEITDLTYEQVKKAAETIAGQQQTTGFKRNGKGIYIESRQIKAAIKEAVNIGFAGLDKPSKDAPTPKLPGLWGPTKKSPKGFTAERVFPDPTEIILGREEPDGIEQVIGHIKDKSGTRSTLGYHEYAMKPVISFVLRVLDDSIKPEWWARIWSIAELNGIGALRSQGYGRFKVTKWEKIS